MFLRIQKGTIALLFVPLLLFSLLYTGAQAATFTSMTFSVMTRTSTAVIDVLPIEQDQTLYIPFPYVAHILSALSIHGAMVQGNFMITDTQVVPPMPASTQPLAHDIAINGVPVEYFTIDPSVAQVIKLLRFLRCGVSVSGNQISVNPNSNNLFSSYAPFRMAFFIDQSPKTPAYHDLLTRLPSLNELTLANYRLNAFGELIGSAPDAPSLEQKVKVDAMISGGHTGGMNYIYGHPFAMNRLIEEIMSLVEHEQYDGINIDFENVPAENAYSYLHFLTLLSTQLHADGKTLSVDVPPETSESDAQTVTHIAYPYTDLSQIADQIDIMAYDYTHTDTNVGPVSPLWWNRDILSYATQHIPPQKILLGIPMYGSEWSRDVHGSDISLFAIEDLIAKNNLVSSWDAYDDEPYVADNGTLFFYENEQSVLDTVDLLKEFPILGVFCWRIGLETNNAWQGFSDF